MTRSRWFILLQMIWLVTAVGIFYQSDYIRENIFVGLGTLATVLIITFGIWFLFISTPETVSTEKRKRQAIDDVLRDLSDEDLLRLRHRLQDGSINDEVLYDQLGEDGEWTRKQRNR